MGTPVPLSFAETIFSNLLKAAIPFAGIVLFFIITFGGFNLVTSGGDPGKTKKAWGTITFGILGLFLIIASYLIIRLIYQFTGVNVGNFQIRQGP
ncbi:hypothetical protein A2188_01875 [Candidatus Woesebacteria bacterium RIFOXYA1_FULL_43_9]|uniref:Uncharacterized protein n=1 Tax=Candidatus Woesebacteria bacterium RIFOXYA1_FULL_43_9 TaxID=1802534 RepID=A0A1F8CJW7_9BACT|nr:MAG: hypothetical protein A2188_01875 [Candidatus Woesebacteria bacterium RIFOXYA1_FULL_43_9]